MKTSKHKTTEDFEMPDVLKSLRNKQVYSVPDNYFQVLEDDTIAEARINNYTNDAPMMFEVPANYFEELPNRIQRQVISQNSLVFNNPLLSWCYAAAALLALVLVCYPFFKPSIPQQNISYQSISDDELNNYLQTVITDMPADDLVMHLLTESYDTYIPADFTIDEQTLLHYDIDADELSSL
jgi:hypothetical protein